MFFRQQISTHTDCFMGLPRITDMWGELEIQKIKNKIKQKGLAEREDIKRKKIRPLISVTNIFAAILFLRKKIRVLCHPYGRKWRLKEPSNESEQGEWKGWLKTQHSENEDHGIRSHHFMINRWGINGNSDRLYFQTLFSIKSLWIVTATMN